MYFKVGPNEKEFSAHASVLNKRIARVCSPLDLSRYVIGFHDDIEDIFGYVLQYLYVGDYQISVLENDSAHIACEDRTKVAFEKVLLLKNNYFRTRASTQQLLDHLAENFPQTPIQPICREAENICQNIDALLIHARLHIFAKKHGMDTLDRLTLWKLVHVLEHMILDSCRIEGVVKLLFLISGLDKADDLYTLMVRYAASRSRLLVRCPRFASLMQKRPELNYSILSNLSGSL